MEDCVLAGVDGSDAGQAALDWAVDEAARRGLRVEALRATSRPLFEAYAEDAYTAFAAGAQESLDKAAAAARDRHPDVPVTTRVSPDFPAAALIAADVRLLVVGSRGRSALPGSAAGSVAYQVAAHAPGPVVVVGTEPVVATGEVLVGVDGVRDAQVPLRAAYVEAQARRARIRAVHTWRHPTSPGSGDLLFPVHDRESAERDEQRRLAEALAGWKTDDPGQVYVAEVHHAAAVPVLTRLSATAELLVVGARGRHGFPLLALGSVAYGVLHHARCPVLIAR